MSIEELDNDIYREAEAAGLYIKHSFQRSDSIYYIFVMPVDGKRLCLSRAASLSAARALGSKYVRLFVNDMIKDFKEAML